MKKKNNSWIKHFIYFKRHIKFYLHCIVYIIRKTREVLNHKYLKGRMKENNLNLDFGGSIAQKGKMLMVKY